MALTGSDSYQSCIQICGTWKPCYNPLMSYHAATYSDSQILATIVLLLAFFAMLIQSRKSETCSRLDFLWKLQATEDKISSEKMTAHNRKLLENILPVHVADHFLCSERKNDDLYHDEIDGAAIMFATIANFSNFYTELEANDEGIECLRLLNEIIAYFDKLLALSEFSCVEKIKTISCTYMAASGLTKKSNDIEKKSHVAAIADFAFSMLECLQEVNVHAFNDFQMRIGINMGPVVAGVIGAKKPHYDIWGNSVNVASRMDSSGVSNKIQITEEVKDILEPMGYKVTCRGVIKIKGKGNMTTYFLDGQPPR